jgi:hypothetical protein
MATIFRSAPAPDTGAVSGPATSVETGGGPAHRPRPWWQRLPALAAPPPLDVQHACLEQLRALLEAARTELSAGWVQGGWWSSDGGRHTVLNGLAAGASGGGPVSAACLVGALIRAGSGQGGAAETGRAIDAVYDALWESQGQPATTSGPGLLTVSSPPVRQARVQALTRWNDARGRTSDEVLAVLDRAIARVIQDLAAIPAPRLPSLDNGPSRGEPSRRARRPA